MSFDKSYFESFGEELKKYFAEYPVGVVTVTIKLGFESEYNIAKIMECADNLLTFSYYDKKKEKALPKRIREERGDLTGFPAITVPYSSIAWVQFNPGIISGSEKMGFRNENQEAK